MDSIEFNAVISIGMRCFTEMFLKSLSLHL